MTMFDNKQITSFERQEGTRNWKIRLKEVRNIRKQKQTRNTELEEEFLTLKSQSNNWPISPISLCKVLYVSLMHLLLSSSIVVCFYLSLLLGNNEATYLRIYVRLLVRNKEVTIDLWSHEIYSCLAITSNNKCIQAW